MSCDQRSARLTVVIHLIDQQLYQVLNVLKNKNWDYQLHTLVKNVTGQSDSDYWLVCWKSGKKSPRSVSSNSEDQRYNDTCFCLNIL